MSPMGEDKAKYHVFLGDPILKEETPRDWHDSEEVALLKEIRDLLKLLLAWAKEVPAGVAAENVLEGQNS
jgi:hypothetical protein